jgi:hypothetical protein
MARLARFAMEFCSIESCGKCTPCRIGSTRGVEAIDRIIEGRDVAANLVLLDDLCETLTKGSLCAMGGLTPMPVQSAIKHWREDLRTGGRGRMTLQDADRGIWDPEVDFGTPAVQAAETVAVTIDGRHIDVPAGTSVLRAATEGRVAIPSSAPPTR